MGKLKQNVCFAENVRLLWRERVVCVAGIAYPRLAGADAENPRGVYIAKQYTIPPARVGTERIIMSGK